MNHVEALEKIVDKFAHKATKKQVVKALKEWVNDSYYTFISEFCSGRGQEEEFVKKVESDLEDIRIKTKPR